MRHRYRQINHASEGALLYKGPYKQVTYRNTARSTLRGLIIISRPIPSWRFCARGVLCRHRHPSSSWNIMQRTIALRVCPCSFIICCEYPGFLFVFLVIRTNHIVSASACYSWLQHIFCQCSTTLLSRNMIQDRSTISWTSALSASIWIAGLCSLPSISSHV